MKNIFTLSISLFLLSCGNTSSYLGHWKCNSSGTVTSVYDGTSESKPITNLYEGLKILPFEFEFKDDGIMIQHNRKTNEGYKQKKYSYFPNYQGDPNKIIVRTDGGEDENVITIKKITAETMEINLDMLGEETAFDLTLNRLH